MRSLAAATALAVVTTAMPAMADSAFQKRGISVAAAPGDPLGPELSAQLSREGRFAVFATGVRGNEPASVIVAAAADGAQRAKLGGLATYVLVPRISFGAIHASDAEPERDGHGNPIGHGANAEVTVTSELTCPLQVQLQMYEVPSGKLLHTLFQSFTLKRKLEYVYTKYDSPRSIATKAGELGGRIAVELSRPPQSAFASQAADGIHDLAIDLKVQLQRLDEFKLQASVMAMDPARDRISFNLGSALNVGTDGWFDLYQGDQWIGTTKVRDIGLQQSEAQVIFLDRPLKLGDRIVEQQKGNIWNGLRAGGLALTTGVLATAGYGLQWDLGPIIGASETYFTLDIDALTNAKSAGAAVQGGFMKKNYVRRWAFSYGVKAGALNFSALTNNVLVPSAMLAGGVDCHLTPEIVWTNDFGLEGLWPIATLASPGKVTVPFGPALRTGFALAF